MTIKHLGGIFGRNPTFNDVTITDITVDDITVNSGGSIRLNGTSDDFLTFQQGGTQAVIHANSATSSNLVLRVTFGGSTKDSLKLLSNGNVQVPSGNVEFTASGQGIDFSATSGTGTSELFDDYEEGAVTNPLYVGGTQITSGYSVNGATYTKVGDTVIMNIYIDYTSPSGSGPTGNVTIGLPFTPTNSAVLGTSIYMSVSAASYAGAFFSVASGVGTVAVTEANVNNVYSLAQGERIIVRAAIAYRAS